MKQLDNYYIWDKGEDVLLTPSFRSREMACPCSHVECVEQKAAVDLMNRLENVRGNAGFPISINSGYRCHAHQLDLAAAGAETAKGISQHELGNAADIRCNSLNSAELTAKAEPLFDCIGVGRRFIHCDTRVGKRRWAYSY